MVNEKALKKYGYLGIKDSEMQIIAYCPLHSAAEAMLEVIKKLVRTSPDEIARGMASQLIAKAESK